MPDSSPIVGLGVGLILLAAVAAGVVRAANTALNNPWLFIFVMGAMCLTILICIMLSGRER